LEVATIWTTLYILSFMKIGQGVWELWRVEYRKKLTCEIRV